MECHWDRNKTYRMRDHATVGVQAIPVTNFVEEAKAAVSAKSRIQMKGFCFDSPEASAHGPSRAARMSIAAPLKS